MATIIPWKPEDLETREQVLAALIQKAIKKIVKQVNAELAQPLTAAAEESPPPQEQIPPGLEQTVLTGWAIFVETDLVPFVEDTFTDGVKLAADAVGEVLKVTVPPVGNEFADEYLSSIYNRMVGVGNTLWNSIRQELIQGFQAGESIPQIAKRLTQFANVNHTRSTVVARTEVLSAANAGTYFQMVDSGLTGVKKQWLATEDTRTRTSHKHADNQEVPLTDEFTVDIYNGEAKIGQEGMEFPGDPKATPGNVIQCRCSLAFEFDEDEQDEVMTAGAFKEAEHPRDKEGKFAKSPGAFLPALDKLTENQFKAFVNGLSQNSWDKYSADQKASIIKRSTTADNSVAEKLGKLFMKSGPAVNIPASVSVPSATAGKPVKLKVQLLYNTKYEAGDVVAVKPDSGERIVWNGKKMDRQKLVNGDWKTSESLTRGALSAKYKDEEGWLTPGAIAPSVATPALAGGKPVKLKVNLLFNTKFNEGDTIAVKPDSKERLIWNGKKIERQTNESGTWKTTETATRGAIMAKYKDEAGWFLPGGATPTPSTTEIVPPAPSEPVLPAPAPAPAPAPLLKPFKFTSTNIIGTDSHYEHKQIVAQAGVGQGRLVWDANKKKYLLQLIPPNSDQWTTVGEYNKQAAYKFLKNTKGWTTSPKKFADDISASIVPTISGNPAPKAHVGTPKPAKKAKFSVAELQAQADKAVLTDTQISNLFSDFKFGMGINSTQLFLSTSPGNTIFKHLVEAQTAHNKKHPGSQINLLEALRAIDKKATPAGMTNKHLWEKKAIEWLQSSPSAVTTANKYIEEAKLSDDEKTALKKAKGTASYEKFLKIPVSAPKMTTILFDPVTHAESRLLRDKMFANEPLTDSQRNAIETYTGSSYSYMNEYLRKAGAVSESYASKSAQLQQAMRPLPQGIKLYRNVNTLFSPTDKFTLEELNGMAGKVMVEKGFSSTSIVDSTFGGKKFRLEIDVPPGTPAVYAQPDSQHKSEYEWVLAAGTKFEIISAEGSYPVVIKMRVVP